MARASWISLTIPTMRRKDIQLLGGFPIWTYPPTVISTTCARMQSSREQTNLSDVAHNLRRHGHIERRRLLGSLRRGGHARELTRRAVAQGLCTCLVEPHHARAPSGVDAPGKRHRRLGCLRGARWGVSRGYVEPEREVDRRRAVGGAETREGQGDLNE